MNYYEHHLGDWAAATGHLTWDEDMAYTRLLRAYYHAEKPIPDGQGYRLAKASTPAQRRAVDAVLQEFFTLEADGWHQKRADAEIARFKATEPEREAKKANEDTRLKRHREERARLFKALTDAGHHAAWNISMNELRELVKRCCPPLPETAPATPATATHTHTQSPYPDPGIKTKNPERGSSLPPSPPPREPEPDAQPTAAGLACRAIKAAGIADVNPGHPTLLRLLEAGQTPELLAATATELAGKGKAKFALLLATVEGRLRDAAAAGAVPVAAVRKDAWRSTDRTLRAMALQLAVPSYPDDTIDVFERRVVKAWRTAGEPALQPSEAQAA